MTEENNAGQNQNNNQNQNNQQDPQQAAPQNAPLNNQRAAFEQFGRVAIHRTFMYFAAMSSLPDDWHKHQRGPHRVFAVLAQRDGMTNAELSEALDVRPSSVTALVSRLEQQGLVYRESSPTDKRVVLIRLTAQGKERVAERHDEDTKMMDIALGSFSDAEREQLSTLLGKVADNLDTEYPEDLKSGAWGRGRGFGGRGFPQHPDFPGRGYGRGFHGPDRRFGGRRFDDEEEWGLQ